MNKTYGSHSVIQNRSSLSALALLVGLPCVGMNLGCSEAKPHAEEQPTVSTAAPMTGDDGARVVSAANTQLNAYAALAVDATAAGTSVTVSDVDDLALDVDGDGDSDPLAPGNLLLVIQMQGATIEGSNDADYGEVTALGGAGLYEFVTVGSISAAGNVITLDSGRCAGGLRNSYTVAGKTQIVRVPEYTSLTVNSNASVVPRDWNGSVGGVVALHVEGETTLTGNATIDASGRGFRGGSADDDGVSRAEGTSVPNYRYTDPRDGGEKGESIAGYQEIYDALGGRYGRGAPANGGGGGNSHNAGGGGGSNPLVLGSNWTGLGVMAPAYADAWELELGTATLANSPGGGRGGYSYSNANRNPLVLGPSETQWLGDGREIVGGLGGRGVFPLELPTATTRAFPGGGGGAGDANDAEAVSGGNGGGIVFLFSGSVSGAGDILANGAAGGSASVASGNNDAAGGGGGGGTVIVRASSIGNVSISAVGGTGGSQTFTNTSGVVEAEGPGGGGGGGHVLLVAATATPAVDGGANGTTNSPPFVPEFPPNGATSGGLGSASSLTTASFPFCVEALGVTLTDDLAEVPAGSETSYTFTVTSSSPIDLTNLAVTLPAGTGFTPTGWTCATPSPDDVDANSCGATGLSGTTGTATVAAIPPGGSVVYTITGTVDAAVGTTLTTQGSVAVGTTEFAATDVTSVVAAELPTISAPTAGVTTPEDVSYVFTADDGNGATTDTPISFTVPGPASQTVTVTITVTDEGADGNGTLTLGTDAGLTFTEGDGTDDATMTFTGTPAAINAALDGATFVPTPNYYDADPTAPDTTLIVSITRTVGTTVEAQIPIGVTPVNDAPVAVDDAVSSLSEDGVINPVANDTDIDGDTLTITSVSEPAHGTVTLGTDGTLTYIPNAGATGTETITYTVSDGHEGGTDEGTITIDLGGGTDSDGDGLSDDFEQTIGSDPNDADTDDDGAIDGMEPQAGSDTDGDGLIDVLDPDSDNDGLFDGTELGQGCDDPATDVGAGFCRADADEGATVTDPTDPDTDDGGVSDGSEDFNLDGQIDVASGETDPTLGQGDDDQNIDDSDADGLSDGTETFLGSDPQDADSDDDGVPDGREANPGADMDGDGDKDVVDPDSDNDGLFDGTEMGFDCSNVDTDEDAGFCIADGDNGTTTTSPVDPDTDDGTIIDGEEDADHDGVVDRPGESDPNDGTDDLCTRDSDCGTTTSGRICRDAAPSVCVDGCRGPEFGNGCPNGYDCSSATERAGVCELIEEGEGGAGGAGGESGAAGTPASGGSAGSSGAAGASGSSGASGAAGSPAGGGAAGAAGAEPTGGVEETGGTPDSGGTAGTQSTGGDVGAAGEAGAGEPTAPEEKPADSLEGGGCTCSVQGKTPRSNLWALLGLGLVLVRRRRQAPRDRV